MPKYRVYFEDFKSTSMRMAVLDIAEHLDENLHTCYRGIQETTLKPYIREFYRLRLPLELLLGTVQEKTKAGYSLITTTYNNDEDINHCLNNGYVVREFFNDVCILEKKVTL